MIYVEPAKGNVLLFRIKGADLVAYVHAIRVYESICKEYITAQVILYDNNNIIENLGIVAGDPAAFAFIAPPNTHMISAGGPGSGYGPVQVLKMKGEQVPGTLKYQKYYVDLIGPVYYQDRESTMTDTPPIGTGTSMIQTIWGQYLNNDKLSVLTPSSGPIGSEDAKHTLPGMKPLTGIHWIMKEMVSDQFQGSGSWVIFKNKYGVNLAQLEALFAGLSDIPFGPISGNLSQYVTGNVTEYFIQKETWGALPAGASWQTGYNDPDLYHAIIVAQVEARPGSSGGRGSGVNISGAANQAQYVFNMASGNIIPQSLASSAFSGGGPSFLSTAQNFMGGGKNTGGNQIMNTLMYTILPSIKTTGERSFSAAVKDGPQIVLKVPLQTGTNVTVGKALWAVLLPPVGMPGGVNLLAYPLSGGWLVTDLVHEIYTDNREAQATTSIQCCKGPVG